MNSRDMSPVRIRPEDKKYIAKVARLTKKTQTEVLHHAVELLKRERQFDEMREAYQDDLLAYKAESRSFDAASGDGLE